MINTLCRERDAVNLLLLRKMKDEEQRTLLKLLIDIHEELKDLIKDNHTLTI